MDAGTVFVIVGFTLVLVVATVVSLGFRQLTWAICVVCVGATSSYVAWHLTYSGVGMLASEPTTSLSEGVIGVTCGRSWSIETHKKFREMEQAHECRQMTSGELLRLRKWNQNRDFELVATRAAFPFGFVAALLAAFMRKQPRVSPRNRVTPDQPIGQ